MRGGQGDSSGMAAVVVRCEEVSLKSVARLGFGPDLGQCPRHGVEQILAAERVQPQEEVPRYLAARIGSSRLQAQLNPPPLELADTTRNSNHTSILRRISPLFLSIVKSKRVS